ncbi:GH13313 [Drosophila grimshawi]|uniref:GH13313 n=1 Tax=Drosophila grimshawi TaxID=7222 RepID=B4JPX7_DROGR|nr:GH13313 [Drosophila grimshawi]
MNNSKSKTMTSLDLPRDYWELKLEPASPASAVASELFALDDPTGLFLYDDNFANGITLISDGSEDCLQEDSSMELISGEELVVEFLNLKDDGKLPKLLLINIKLMSVYLLI